VAIENVSGMLGSLSTADDVKFDFFKLNGLTMVHRQIEHRKGGYVFMRSKKRPVVVVERKE